MAARVVFLPFPSILTTFAPLAATMPISLGTAEVIWPSATTGVLSFPVTESTVMRRVCCLSWPGDWVRTADSPTPHPGL